MKDDLIEEFGRGMRGESTSGGHEKRSRSGPARTMSAFSLLYAGVVRHFSDKDLQMIMSEDTFSPEFAVSLC